MTTETKPKPIPIADQIAGLMQAMARLTSLFNLLKELGFEAGERDEIMSRLNALLKTASLVRDNEAKIRAALSKK